MQHKEFQNLKNLYALSSLCHEKYFSDKKNIFCIFRHLKHVGKLINRKYFPSKREN